MSKVFVQTQTSCHINGGADVTLKHLNKSKK